jgi:hypothetical protein
MTILSPDTLVNVLDLIADGTTVAEATTAIGGAPKSKIIFAWLADSEAAGEFDPPPDPESKWCITWRGKLEWFHLHYRDAVIDGKEIRRVRRSPLRAELEARLALKRAAPPPPRPAAPVVSREPTPALQPNAYDQHGYVAEEDRPASPPRPSYAYRRPPPLDAVNTRQGPPEEGRFSISRHVVSRAERKAGTPEITEFGIRWN